MRVTVADCERNQAAWNDALALAGGGEVWLDGELRWAWQRGNGHLMLNFPASVDAAAARRGVRAARARHARIVGAWLGGDVDPSGLEAAGFERGWEPWWMGGPIDAIASGADDRVALSADVPEELPERRARLSLAASGGPPAWHAVARLDGRLVGRAWAFAPDDVAGVYDMEVWPPFQRQGLGRALLRALAAAARTAGVRGLGLNATPRGSLVYAAEGLARLGTGITYWHHLSTPGRVYR